MIWPNSTEWLGLSATIALVGCAMAVVCVLRIPRVLKGLLIAALTLRVFGALTRYIVLTQFYGGVGDAIAYYQRGLAYAESFWQLDFSPVFDSALWSGTTWWGTNFVAYPSAIALGLFGPSLVGEFILFSLLSFVGLAGFALAFRRAFPDVSLWRYVVWIWLFPSLWFWPSSVGKEAIILAGIGLAVAGFAGRRGRIRWLLLAFGLLFIVAVRPQVAAVLLLSMILGFWLAGDRWHFGKSVQALAVAGIGVWGIWLSMRYLGVEAFDLNQVGAYLDENTARAGGGSQINEVGVGLQNIPNALVSIFFRPFPWDITNAMVAFSAIEVMTLWGIVLFRWRNVLNAVRHWRSHRLLTMAAVFILTYSVVLGMLLANLGIIARQRIFLFPFLFLFLEAVPAKRRSLPPELDVAHEPVVEVR